MKKEVFIMDSREKRELEQRAEKWIGEHKGSLIADISRLVKIRSVSDPAHGTESAPYGEGCKKVLEEALAIGREHGFETTMYDNRVGAMWYKEGRWEDTIGFWGHMDVVPEGGDWDNKPYEPVYRDGYLIGRGARDNKGPTMAVMYVIECLKDLKVNLRRPLRLFLGCDEEKGMSDLEYYTEHYPCPGLSMVADCGFPVCYGEKGIIEADLMSGGKLSDAVVSFSGGVASNMVPDRANAVLNPAFFRDGGREKILALGEKEGFTVSCKGENIAVEARGISKHTAFPVGGVNAIQQLALALAESGALPEQDTNAIKFICQVNQDFEGTGLNIAYSDEVSGALTCVGSMADLTDRRLTQLINIRYSITADSEQLIRNMDESCKKAGWEMQLLRDSKPNYFPKERPEVELLTNLFNKMTGLEKPPYVMGGGTYARKLPNAFAYGMGGVPGSEAPEGLFRKGHGGAHEPDEGLDVEGLIKAMKIYVMALIELDELQVG